MMKINTELLIKHRARRSQDVFGTALPTISGGSAVRGKNEGKNGMGSRLKENNIFLLTHITTRMYILCACSKRQRPVRVLRFGGYYYFWEVLNRLQFV